MAAGFTAEDYAADELSGGEVEVWPDNVDAANVFTLMVTQWRVGPGGPVGLDYNVLPFVYRQARVPRRAERDVFDSIRVMEDEALKQIRGQMNDQ